MTGKPNSRFGEQTAVLDRTVVVAHKARLSESVVSLVLRDPNGADLPTWAPGAHIDVVLPTGDVRQYSLCGDVDDRQSWRIAVLLEPQGRGGSRYLHTELVEGEQLRVAFIRNHFPLMPSPSHLFIAGGIGITPLLPMISAVHRSGSQWRMLYGGRSRKTMAFLNELSRYGDKVVVAPQDEVGLLDLKSWLSTPTPQTRVYCCGPEPLLRAVEELCQTWPAGSLELERFHSSVPLDGGEVGSFEIELATSGLTLKVPPDKSVLDVLEGAGVEILSSCREGTCGTCETVVLDGVPDHRDSLLTAAEKELNDLMFVCVSRSRTPTLVLAL